MSAGAEPTIRVVAGHPTDEELAALLVVIAAVTGESSEPARPVPADGWSAPWRGLRAPLRPGPDAWRLSGRP